MRTVKYIPYNFLVCENEYSFPPHVTVSAMKVEDKFIFSYMVVVLKNI